VLAAFEPPAGQGGRFGQIETRAGACAQLERCCGVAGAQLAAGNIFGDGDFLLSRECRCLRPHRAFGQRAVDRFWGHVLQQKRLRRAADAGVMAGGASGAIDLPRRALFGFGVAAGPVFDLGGCCCVRAAPAWEGGANWEDSATRLRRRRGPRSGRNGLLAWMPPRRCCVCG